MSGHPRRRQAEKEERKMAVVRESQLHQRDIKERK
jgi:hypothetical protein